MNAHEDILARTCAHEKYYMVVHEAVNIDK